VDLLTVPTRAWLSAAPRRGTVRGCGPPHGAAPRGRRPPSRRGL